MKAFDNVIEGDYFSVWVPIACSAGDNTKASVLIGCTKWPEPFDVGKTEWNRVEMRR